jgi:hypothetical protein
LSAARSRTHSTIDDPRARVPIQPISYADLALNAVVTSKASSATMQDAIDLGANTRKLFTVLFCSGMAISARLHVDGPRHEDEP